MIPLSRRNLRALAEIVKTPLYRRDDQTAGILHMGVGNFHRSHQGVYLDDLFNLRQDLDWAVVGASVRTSDKGMRQDLMSQDWLTTVVEQEADQSNARITASMVDFIAPGESAAILGRLRDPAIRIVSLTITEGGYFIDPSSLGFDGQHPEITADVANLATPRTVFGLIVSALMQRRANGTPPFSVMSCDNLPGNGHVTANTVTGLATLVDPSLARWIEDHVAFPNSMVDRITPATTDRERLLLQQSYGLRDDRPVFCEAFKQWVLEDTFSAGRPSLEKVGVQFVKDVAPFEFMKIRMLNGGHAAIAYPAALLDISLVHEAMANPWIGGFLSRLLDTEIIPVVSPVPGTDLGDYKSLIEQRFANPKVADRTERLCYDGSNRQPKFILPTVTDRLKKGLPVDGLALVCAFWCRYCLGESESGNPIVSNDPNWSRLQNSARSARADPTAWLGMADIFGDVAQNEHYRAAFSEALECISIHGTEQALSRYVTKGVINSR